MAENIVAYVFPGQGSQEVGMGKKLYERYSSARKIFDLSDTELGFSISSLCFNGPEEELIQTVNVQPAILTTSIACLEVAREIAGAKLPSPSFVAGHSVGEYAALVANGMLDIKDAVSLVRTRGRLMQEAGQYHPGAMAAIIGADENSVNDICRESDTEISNINSPGQIVISGTRESIAKAKILAESKGIRRIIPLKVSGAFHSRLMQQASDGLKTSLENIKFANSRVPVVSNVSANLLNKPADIPLELSTQIVKCVQWQKSVETMISKGVNTFIEFGHGQVITNLIKRIDASVKVYNMGDIETENQINVIISEMK